MSNPYTPTLRYPNGGETIVGGTTITTTWTTPTPASDDYRLVQIELFYTDDYEPNREPTWIQIASVPSSDTSYPWRVPNFIHSPRCRVAVRAKNSRGERSGYSVSAANFLITHKKLKTPALISPTSHSRYDKYIEIVPDDRAVAGSYSQRSRYQFFYSSVSANVPPTPLSQGVPVGTKSVVWNTIDVPPANDYAIGVYVADDDGNRSDTLIVEGITIAHEGFFLIDTVPPVASITINSGEEFTRFRDVSVNIVSYDETTGVHSMQLIEGTNKALPEPVASVRPFKLSEDDGTKVVELLLQDFSGNRNITDIQRLFENILEQTGLVIEDIAFDSGVAWVATSGTANSLYSIEDYPQKVYTFTGVPTAVGVYNSLTYVATKSATNKGTLYRYTGALTVDAINTFTDSDSVINCIANHGIKMYLGFENGNVYSYDGYVLVKVDEMSNPVSSLMSDGSSLYLAMRNDDGVYIYDGSGFVKTGE
jgi:hypothetical protein